MKKVSAIASIAAITLAAGCLFQSPEMAFADDEDEFTDLMMKGVGHFKAGRSDPSEYQKAIDAFKAAREINPIPDATYNIARSYHMMDNCEMALASYREYAATSVENADSVKDFIADLTERCGSNAGVLRMRCVPEDALVSIDGGEPSRCVAEQTLPTGDHRIVITSDGYLPESRSVSVSAKDNSTPIVVELHKDQSVPVVNDAPKPEPVPAQTTDWRSNYPSGSSSAASATALAVASTQAPMAAQAEVVASPVGAPSAKFWAGVVLSSMGTLASLAGGLLAANAYEEAEYVSHDNLVLPTFDEKKSWLYAGYGLLGFGTAAVITGIVLFVVDRYSTNTDGQDTSVTPSFSLGVDSATAGVSFTF